MADSSIRRIKRDPTNAEAVQYLDYLADRLEYILENIGEENLTDQLRYKIGGQNVNKRSYTKNK